MKILSRFKDYYDFVGHLYGADPLVIYDRKPLTELNEVGYRPDLDVEAKIDFSLPYYFNGRTEDRRWYYKAIVIAETAYLLQHDTKYPLSGYKLYDWEADPQELERHYYWRREGNRDYPDSKPRECLIELAKKIGTPVYMINSIKQSKGDSFLTIDANIPILSDYGFASIIPATKLFQDMTYFIGNTMHSNPDRAPPVEVGNADRLTQYGFDKKISFRHRRIT